MMVQRLNSGEGVILQTPEGEEVCRVVYYSGGPDTLPDVQVFWGKAVHWDIDAGDRTLWLYPPKGAVHA